MEEHYIPKYLQAYPQLLWWELDEAAIFLSFIFLGIMVNKGILFGAIGLIMTRLYTRIKYRKQSGFLIHFLYAVGLYGPKKVPPYWVKEVVK